MRFLALPLALLIAAVPATAQTRGGWTRAWTASMWQGGTGPNLFTVEGVTIRSAVRVGAGGTALRLRLSNEHGDAVVRVGAATVRSADGRIARVTFGGAPTARIGAGAPLVSDAVALSVKPFEVVEVSIFLPEKTALSTLHGAGGAPTAVSAPGDFTAQPGFAAASTLRHRPMIAGIDVLGARSRPVIVAYGDSITDNTGCANDAPVICRWGDMLGRRLTKAGKPHVVVTQAISGNRVLTPGAGPSALARFDRDVLAVPGVSHVVLLEGINDIGNMTPDNIITADDLIAGFRQLIARAHDRGIKVYASPILPWKGAARFTPGREAIRVAVNRWIRSSGEFDAVIDLERPVADPADPLRLATALQTGDNLHPNGAGEAAMGDAVPLGLFR
ncbi:MAG: SGNH/GDSL hydrolase family protein [Pseudomonadota bacterium]